MKRVATIVLVSVIPGLATHVSSEVDGSTSNDGATITVVETRAPLAPSRRAEAAGKIEPALVPKGPVMEYRTVIDCAGNSLDDPDGTITCYSATRACAATGEPGPQSSIYRRTPGQTTWTYLGKTCAPAQFQPPTPAAPTLGDIQRAFSETPFATPTGTTQPPGGATLVNLRTYFTLAWPDQGYRPGQTRTLTLLGHTVDLYLTSPGHTYHFGDGTTAGPTPSLGGPYPTGDITHTYPHAGTVTPTATTTITADYRIDGGPWLPLPGHATQTTAFPVLTVLTATNRLHADPR